MTANGATAGVTPEQEVALEIELATDQAILACGGDMREAVKALILMVQFLEDELAQIGYGYDRGRTRSRGAG